MLLQAALVTVYKIEHIPIRAKVENNCYLNLMTCGSYTSSVVQHYKIVNLPFNNIIPQSVK